MAVVGDPGVETPGQPAEAGSHQKCADGMPYGMTGTKHRGHGCVAAGHPTSLVDPPDRCPALVRGEAELGQVQALPWRNGGPCGGWTAAHHPARQKSRAGGAEPAVSVEDQDR